MQGRTDGPRSFRSWPLLMLAFGSLLLLMVGSYVLTLRGAADLHATVARVNETHHANARNIIQIRSRVEATRLLARDFLLDPTSEHGDWAEAEMSRHRAAINDHIRAIGGFAESDAVARLQTAFEEYCKSMEPILAWEPEKHIASAYRLLRKDVTPRRERVSELVEEIEAKNDETLSRNVQSIAAAEERFTASMTRMMIASAVLGLLVALASVARVRVLESRSHQHRRLTEEAEQKMRKLSQQVVRAQEDERRSISRELHDEVGQMLTGLRMELRGLLRMQEAPAAEFQRQVEQARTVVDQTLQSIRDIAMGLRPSMLDDLGLDAALRWQAREFCRRHDIPVTVEINADLSHLPEQHRTNLYRIVQEGLTNCARHAQARSVTVHIDRTDSELTVSVIDDGIGAVNGARSAGLGLIGIQERARELGGTADLRSRRPAAGTALTVTVPVAWKESYVESSSAACG